MRPVELGAEPCRLLQLSADAPTALLYLYEIYAELAMCRRPGLAGIEPITHEQVYFWQQASRFTLKDWERKTLLAVDLVYRRVQQNDYVLPNLGSLDDD